MGNKVNVSLKEGTVLEINEALVRNFQDRIYMMDKSVASFANAIDSLEAIGDKLCRHIHSRTDNLNESKSYGNAAEDTALAETIMTCVSDHKFIVLESASQLIHYVIDIGKNVTECNYDLAIDRYEYKHDVGEIPYYDKRLRDMLTEIEQLRQNYKREKSLVRILKDRENLYRKEKEEKTKELENLKLENVKLQNVIRERESEIEGQNSMICEKDKQIETQCAQKTEMYKKANLSVGQIHSLIEEIRSSIKQQETGDFDKISLSLPADDINHKSKSQEESFMMKYDNCLEDSFDEKIAEIQTHLIRIKKYLVADKLLPLKNIEGEYQTSEEKKHQLSQTENDVLPGESNEPGRVSDEIERNRQLDEVKKQNIKLTNEMKLLKLKVLPGESNEPGRVSDEIERNRQLDEVKKQNIKLTNEMKLLQLKVRPQKSKKTHVQVYYEIGVKKGAKERAIMQVIQSVMAKESIDLQISELYTSSPAQRDIPLLIISIRNYGYCSLFKLPEYWPSIEEFKGVKAKALVTLHRTLENPSEKEIVESESITQNTARRFDIGYIGLFKRFDFSEPTIRPIVDFILEKGLRNVEARESDV